ncbi:MAG TPA: glutathione S-transferase family protein [Pseudolabrys sp.]|jgi:glutathione S-transferase|nr:glutathione S-transferase family protein [Pseudolabrys sp.]
MKLYAFPPSPNTWKVRAVASYVGVPLELEIVDLTKPRSAAYLAINPSGRTPTLVDGNFTLTESNAIMQYIACQKPNSLWPDDARARADIMRWQCWQLAHWGSDACVPLVFNRLVKKILNLGPPDAVAVAKATAAFNKEAALLEDHLAKQPYLVGKEVTLADFSVAANLLYAKEAELPLGPYPRVQEWLGRVSALPCWRETAPQRPAAAA